MGRMERVTAELVEDHLSVIPRIATMSVRMVMINRSVFRAIKSWWKT